MNYDFATAARIALGRALLRAAKHLNRAGAHLLRHPSAQPAFRRVRRDGLVRRERVTATVHPIRRSVT